ncbi:MAG: hypothetical protein UT39_C0007G0008 [Candidatus Woesebacteria bacterium GW2011_GWA1_39_21]|uniref:Uncharacterized protein n=1 Tax=Candidatus Woesebacteria bacterium GW2011_GWA1_39_21 TaxID=1618550 RepID=A0A0G0N7K6_9BACT|nr:MAG: hypothetical protein UT39_C0007G0008 [Candidatus Woesebacteria bacterium GW2011_GWA1_39_21]
MKIDKLEIVTSCLKIERKGLLDAIEKITVARNESPLPTETRSDTSRIQADRMLSELDEKLKLLEILISNLPGKIKSAQNHIGLWSYLELVAHKTLLKIILVPDGYGGRQCNDIKLLSEKTPLGKIILAKVTEKNLSIINYHGLKSVVFAVEFNNKKFVIKVCE